MPTKTILSICLLLLFVVGNRVHGIVPSPTFVPNAFKVESLVEWTKHVHTFLGDCIVPKLAFKCTFPRSTGTLFYQIHWFINGEHLLSKGITEDPLLREDDFGISRKLGFNVACGVTTYQSIIGPPGSTTMSSTFFAGIRPTQNRIRVERGKAVTFDLEFTVPFACNYCGPRLSTCSMSLEMYYNKSRSSSCKSNLGSRLYTIPYACAEVILGISKGEYENGTKWNTSYSWKITTIDDSLFERGTSRQFFVLWLRTKSENLHSVWNNYILQNIQVEVYERNTWRNTTCQARASGVQIVTFDGSRYAIQKEGVFSLYKHKVLPIEAQVKIKPCGFAHSSSHCIFGVYIRSGADVFVVATDRHHIKYHICNDNSMDVYYKSAEIYEIFLAVGTTITIRMVNNGALDIDIDAAPADENKTDGLCGDLDNNKVNDFIVNGVDLGQITICGSNGFHQQCRSKFTEIYRHSRKARC